MRHPSQRCFRLEYIPDLRNCTSRKGALCCMLIILHLLNFGTVYQKNKPPSGDWKTTGSPRPLSQLIKGTGLNEACHLGRNGKERQVPKLVNHRRQRIPSSNVHHRINRSGCNDLGDNIYCKEIWY
jgi:hypothetical protein